MGREPKTTAGWRDRVQELELERDAALERAREAERQLARWFDTRKIAEKELVPEVLLALSSYLKVRKLSPTLTRAINHEMSRFCHLYLALIVVPAIRKIAQERTK